MSELFSNIEFSELLLKLEQLESLTPEKTYRQDDLDSISLAFSNTAIPGAIGKRAKAKSSKIYFDGNEPVQFYIKVPLNFSQVEILISDVSGNIVYEFPKFNFEKILSEFEFNWSGFNQKEKSFSKKGEYSINAIFEDMNGNNIPSESLIIGRINRMSFGKQSVFFEINNILLPLEDVLEIYV